MQIGNGFAIIAFHASGAVIFYLAEQRGQFVLQPVTAASFELGEKVGDKTHAADIDGKAKRLVAQHTGLPAHHMLMSATHAHTATAAVPVFQSQTDAEYLRFLTRGLPTARGLRSAISGRPRLAGGWGKCRSMSSTGAGR